ncbi:MAG: hypothetical protein SCARUB_02471 [Candidatus Scalindua rubra]|uniref:Uncharacterized protein n=1 Tax=Candidatus Scalindua rubra TaxID=1872076 RepID=A0A1E3XBS1_9BACT|nr:MAG: hypothetical protein SCARUB_02471 [Candidatus Scalindua rubra]
MYNKMNNYNRYIWIVFAFDGILIILHLWNGEQWSFINLGEEQNLTTWYSSIKLLMLGLLSFACRIMEDKQGDKRYIQLSWWWFVIGSIFIWLSMDEVSTFHERIARSLMNLQFGSSIRETVLQGDRAKDAFIWVLFLSPLIIVVLYIFVRFFWKRFSIIKSSCIFSMLGCFLFLLSPALEAVIYFLPPLAQWNDPLINKYFLITSIEESAELLGSSCFFIAFVNYIKKGL